MFDKFSQLLLFNVAYEIENKKMLIWIFMIFILFSKSYYNLKHFVLVVLYEKMLNLLKCNVFRNNFSILEFIFNKRIEVKMDWDFEKIIFLLNE